MINNIQLYNFYRRYRWTAADFSGWQEGMVDHSRGMFEGLMAGAVLQGFEAATGPGLSLNIHPGIASGPSGYLHVSNETELVVLDAATGSVRKDLIVSRPNLVDNRFITNPMNPFQQVPLRTAQESSLVVLKGVEANSPQYPTPEVNDVVLLGVRVENGQTNFSPEDLDFEVRDIPGKNSNFQQDAGRFDDRLRPYLSTNKIMGIKPSQLGAPFARVFSYVSSTGPSIFPKNLAGEYNHADTFVNLETGEISGGDEVSDDFVPEIPSAGNAVIATIGIVAGDSLSVTYGEEGTREECYNGVINQKSSGPGSVVFPTCKPVAFVMVYSEDGVNVTEIAYVDCRGAFGITLTPTVNIRTVDDTGNILSTDEIVLGDTDAGGFTRFLPQAASLEDGKKYTFKNVGSSGNLLTIQVNSASSGTDSIDNEFDAELADMDAISVVKQGNNFWII